MHSNVMFPDRLLGEREYVWIDGGQVSSGSDFWARVASELQLPSEITSGVTDSAQSGGVAGFQAGFVLTANGSYLRTTTTSNKRIVGSMAEAMNVLLNRQNNISY
jgi:hypothetical protein